MARILKQLLRFLFAIEAASTLYILGLLALHRLPSQAAVIAGASSIPVAIGLATFIIFAAAFWTTRGPLYRRKPFAIAACLLNIVFATLFALSSDAAPFTPHGTIAFNAGLFAVSSVGFIFFLRREKPAAPSLPPARLATIPGDRTLPRTNQVVTLLFVVAAFLLAYVWNLWAGSHGLSRPQSLLMLGAIALALTVTAVIHESGHALAGAAFGMKLLALTIGPFRWVRRSGQWRFQFNRRIFGGRVTSAPTNLAQPRAQDAFMVFAGPLANLLTAPLFLLAAIHLPGTHLQFLWFPTSFLASLSLVVPILNLVPFRTATGEYSDGARLLQMFTASPIVEYQRAMRALDATLVTPLRPRDLDPSVFQRAAALRPAELAGLHAHLCAARILEDQGRPNEALSEIDAAEAMLAHYSMRVPSRFLAALVWFSAIYRRSAASARHWWDRIDNRNRSHDSLDYWLAAAALAWIEGQSELPAHNQPQATPQPASQSLFAQSGHNLRPRANGSEAAWREASTLAQSLHPSGATDFTCDRLALLRNLLNEAERIPAPAQQQSALPTDAPLSPA
ncbi:MAG TPA: M50 family metallopeptidase [Acidobacteriaceae bacterium]|nr:M50 family metallopeptidase [Acidobacteriaceae bacterium]